MNIMGEIKEYGVIRKEECSMLDTRLEHMIKDMKRYKEKVHWAATESSEDDRVNIGMEYIREFEYQLQIIVRSVVEVEKINARLDLLRDMKGVSDES